MPQLTRTKLKSWLKGARRQLLRSGLPGTSARLDSLADEAAVRYSYLYLLGREPENATVVQQALSLRRTNRKLAEDVRNSDEYQHRIKLEFFRSSLAARYTEWAYGGSFNDATRNAYMLMQTSDAERYAPMLAETARYNRRYANKFGMSYVDFIGLKRGCYPHHATLNRIWMLNELIDQGYCGWVLYLDADSVMVAPGFSFPRKAAYLRSQGKGFYLHNVHPKNHEKFNWWDINMGAFGADLGMPQVRAVLRAWSYYYDFFYQREDYERASNWNDVHNDQTVFHSLMQMLERADIINAVEHEQFQFDKVCQILRSDDKLISSEVEMQGRIERLREAARRGWGADV